MNLGEWLWAMFVFFLLFQVIFIFIRVFADIFHRRDLSGVAKAGWILLLFVIPFLRCSDLLDRSSEDDRAGSRGHPARAGGAATRVRALAR